MKKYTVFVFPHHHEYKLLGTKLISRQWLANALVHTLVCPKGSVTQILLLNIDLLAPCEGKTKWSSHCCYVSGLFLYGSSLCFCYQQPSTFSLKLRGCTVTPVSTVLQHFVLSACSIVFFQLYYRKPCSVTRLSTALLVTLQEWGHFSGKFGTKQ
jgi:hypothetical protein